MQGNSCSIAQKSGEIVTTQLNLQPISFKSDRLLARYYVYSGFVRQENNYLAKIPAEIF